MRELFVGILLIAATAALLAGHWSDMSGPLGYEMRTLKTESGETFRSYVADTDEKRRLGLAVFDDIRLDEGMLFVFPSDGRHGIWMKDMRFPIDIVWLDRALLVIDVRAHVVPESYPEIFYPRAPARYVLELPAGAAARSLRPGAALFEQN